MRIRGRPTLEPQDISFRNGIPVTGPARTLVDLGTELSPIRLERAVNEADKHDLIDPETLRVRLDEYAGQPGPPMLRRLLDKRTFRLSDSDLGLVIEADGLRYHRTYRSMLVTRRAIAIASSLE